MVARELPIVVVGAGPVGLAAAAHLTRRGLPFRVLEAGAGPGSHVAAWAHVRMFSPWRTNVDPVAREMLAAAGWTPPPDDALPTGGELVAGYLEPLAALPAIAAALRTGRRVTAVGRLGHDRMRDGARGTAPFDVRYVEDGREGRILARAVLDASGTWSRPNPLGTGGLPALGEGAAARRILHGVPDVLGRHRDRFAGRRVLVVGGGDSAFNALAALVRLADDEPQTEIVWALRGEAPAFGGGAADALPARGALGERVRRLLAAGRLRLLTGFAVDELVDGEVGVAVHAAGHPPVEVDVVVAATGYRPDHALASELRLDLDAATESPAALGPLIDPNVHSCGTVPPHGVDELSHPDAGYYALGIKSYGRAPTFLLLTGYEQVRSVVAELAGDAAAARQVRLTLPETGVCSTAPAAEERAPAASLLTAAAPAAAAGCR